MAGSAIAIGVATRTGSAVAVAVSGFAGTPRFMARREMRLVPVGLPAQPFHAAAGLDLTSAGEMIGEVERRVEETAVAGLHAVADGLPAAAAVIGVAVTVKAVSLPGRLEDVMRSHAWMHAAEGVLYREPTLAAARRCGWAAHAVEVSSLPPAEQAQSTLGWAAGHPWRRIEKDAARVAITLLPETPSRL